MPFLLVTRDFIFILGLFYTFLIFWIAFIGIQLLEDVMVPKRTEFWESHQDLFYDLSPRIHCASWMSLGMMVTLLACTAQRLASSRGPTRYASEASCNAIIAPLWNLMFTLPRSWASSLTSLWNGSFLMSNSVDFWYHLISHRATVPGQYL